MAASLRSPAVVTLLLSTLLFFSGYATLFFYFKQFGLSRGIVNTSLFFSTATVVMIAVRLLGSWLFDRCHKVQLCAAGLVLASVCYALLPLCASSPGLALLAGFSGLGWGIAMPLQAAAMFDLSPPAYRAMNQNLLVVMMQGGFFLGPCIGGLLLDRFGYTVLFLTLAAATLVAGLLLLGIRWLPPNQGDATSGSAMSISHE
jgi:predicted MFS family arabinose efflux permease